MNKITAALLTLLLVISLNLQAKGTYEEPAVFLNRIFDQQPPKPKKLWIKADVKNLINNVLGHDLNTLRLRYWQKDDRTVWILEEIGRDKPITTGISIRENRIEQVSVLIFRESRGWEIRYPFFTDQFRGVTSDDKKGLSDHIDGISGATLSVNAVTKLALLALKLTQHIENNERVKNKR